jgi:CRP-like cAMP-binding protein
MPSASRLTSALRSLSARFALRREDDEKRAVADLLADVPLFSSLKRGMLLDLAEAVHQRTYRRDEFLFYQGDPGIGLFVIRSGGVRLLVEDAEGAMHEIRTAGEGEVLGIEGVIGDGSLRRRESAQATGDTRVIGIFSPEYRTLQRRHPRTGAAIAGLLARHAAAALGELQALLSERGDPVAAGTLADEAVGRAATRLRLMQGM